VLFRNFAFFIAEAGRGLFKNGWMSLASIGVVAIALLIFGIFVLLNMNVELWTEELREQIEIVAFIEDDAAASERRDLSDLIAQHDDVREVEFVSKGEAFEDLKEMLGEGALEGYEPEENPLRDSYVIRVIEPEMVFGLIDELEELPAVGDVICHKEIVKGLTNFTQALQSAALALMLLLAITATFLIAHTIRLTVMLRSKEIMIMKYVGATDTFIRLPFLFEGLFLGIIGTVIPLACIYYGYGAMIELIGMDLAFLPVVPFNEAITGTASLIVPLGIGLGVVGSLFSIGKYLKV